MSTAIITGASRGLGLALAHALHQDGWTLVLTARHADALDQAAALRSAAASPVLGTASSAAGRGLVPRTAEHPGTPAKPPFPQPQGLWKRRGVTALTGDVTDPAHRQQLIDAAGRDLTLLVNNASFLGPSPQPNLADYPLDVFRQVYEVNVTAPLALAQLALPTLRRNHGRIVNITSDASVEPYAGWGGYGSSKAALNQLSRILDAEEPDVTVTAVDPGDMRTQMHQEAFPGEDISDRPLPEEHAVPALLALVNSSTVLEGATP